MTVAQLLDRIIAAYPGASAEAMRAFKPVFLARLGRHEGPLLAAAAEAVLAAFRPTARQPFPIPADLEAHLPGGRLALPDGSPRLDFAAHRQKRRALVAAWRALQGRRIEAARGRLVALACERVVERRAELLAWRELGRELAPEPEPSSGHESGGDTQRGVPGRADPSGADASDWGASDWGASHTSLPDIGLSDIGISGGGRSGADPCGGVASRAIVLDAAAIARAEARLVSSERLAVHGVAALRRDDAGAWQAQTDAMRDCVRRGESPSRAHHLPGRLGGALPSPPAPAKGSAQAATGTVRDPAARDAMAPAEAAAAGDTQAGPGEGAPPMRAGAGGDASPPADRRVASRGGEVRDFAGPGFEVPCELRARDPSDVDAPDRKTPGSDRLGRGTPDIDAPAVEGPDDDGSDFDGADPEGPGFEGVAFDATPVDPSTIEVEAAGARGRFRGACAPASHHPNRRGEA